MKRELAEVKMERSVQRISPRSGGEIRSDWADALSYPVSLMCCWVLDVSKSGFYARRARPSCDRERENARLEIKILFAHQRTRGAYSAICLHRDLADHGI